LVLHTGILQCLRFRRPSLTGVCGDHIECTMNDPEIDKAKTGECFDVPLYLTQPARASINTDEEVGPEQLDGKTISSTKFLVHDDPSTWPQRSSGFV